MLNIVQVQFFYNQFYRILHNVQVSNHFYLHQILQLIFCQNLIQLRHSLYLNLKKIIITFHNLKEYKNIPDNLNGSKDLIIEKTGVAQIDMTFPVSSGLNNSNIVPFATAISCCFGPEKLPTNLILLYEVIDVFN